MRSGRGAGAGVRQAHLQLSSSGPCLFQHRQFFWLLAVGPARPGASDRLIFSDRLKLLLSLSLVILYKSHNRVEAGQWRPLAERGSSVVQLGGRPLRPTPCNLFGPLGRKLSRPLIAGTGPPYEHRVGSPQCHRPCASHTQHL